MALWHIWLIAALLFFIIEIFTVGIAVICFSFGAVAASICAACGGSVTWQVILFAAVSIAAFIFIRPLLLKIFNKKKDEVKTNVDALAGRKGLVSQTIDPSKNEGRVAIDGDDWKAVTPDGSVIEKGEQVEILKVESVILTVKKL